MSNKKITFSEWIKRVIEFIELVDKDDESKPLVSEIYDKRLIELYDLYLEGTTPAGVIDEV